MSLGWVPHVSLPGVRIVCIWYFPNYNAVVIVNNGYSYDSVGYIHDRVEGSSISAEGKEKGICHHIFQGHPESVWKPELTHSPFHFLSTYKISENVIQRIYNYDAS